MRPCAANKSGRIVMTEADRATTLFDFRAKRVYVAGHNGMVGSAIVRRLKSEACEILTVDHATLDLTRQDETERWIGSAKPDAVIVSAAKVGGIAFNSAFPVNFLADNLAIALNVISASYAAGAPCCGFQKSAEFASFQMTTSFTFFARESASTT